MHWQDAAQQAQGQVHAAIPSEWKLPKPQEEYLHQDIRSVPRNCGILTEEQLTITEQSATRLVKRLAAGEITSAQAVKAFCTRAAIAHQLVRVRARESPQEAVARHVFIELTVS